MTTDYRHGRWLRIVDIFGTVTSTNALLLNAEREAMRLLATDERIVSIQVMGIPA